VNQAPAEESPQAPRPAYDFEVAHTIWELERTVRRGRVTDATRLSLVNAHMQQLRMVEGRVGIAEASRSFALLQDRIVRPPARKKAARRPARDVASRRAGLASARLRLAVCGEKPPHDMLATAARINRSVPVSRCARRTRRRVT
jgi:hypothetical protein